MRKFIIGLLIGISMTLIICYGIYDSKETKRKIELFSVSNREYIKGFQHGTKWGIQLQRHNELMKKEK